EEMRAQLAGKGAEETTAAPSAPSGEEYYCKACGPGKRVPFEEASGSLFKCGACGSSLEYFDKSSKPPAA
ncbi:MAG: hypothetical protein KGH63_02075, partial [Candidatus Micrarchaeota archaeon]|nr:hypothetical protein [Candidatus Micrarchaeota archaeon]